ncbi:MAG TPA: phosphatase domain-containing protein [Intrasporangium sp.]|uniref:App1 family protein n=1 Tax=Intrasporangium sp. TaxID=1925024 RepID=UPI002D7719A6|nr:phosphatase domain-containing protein [Intrasporangium sp.]HET7399180.1 phosphatase domain-containing protein [Intrasporangium sp.]
MSRPHAAALIEDAVNARIERLLRGRGWGNRVLTHIGYGSTSFVRVFARVVLGRGGSGGPPSRQDATGALAPAHYERGWRVFLAAPASGVPVTVTIGERTVHARSDRGGHVDLVAHDHGLAPGWQQVVVHAPGTDPVPADVFIVGDDVDFGLISDIDDTVITTMLPRPLIAAWNTFVLRAKNRHAVHGMAPFYRAVLSAHPGAPTVYVSTGAWNTAPPLTRFLLEAGYPLGPLLLTDWGPTNTGWFRSGREHKRDSLERMARDFPNIRWLLVGDDGQHDPQLYADFAEARPDHVAAVCIRQLTATEQVLSHPMGRLEAPARPSATHSVPTYWAPDGHAMRRALEEAGLIGKPVAADEQPSRPGR